LKSFPEIGTRLAAVGEWRATVTENDWEYVEQVQVGGGGAGGGHATGGALSLLYHRALGPILTASMTEYQMVEISNQQAFRDGPHMTLTPRIEFDGALDKRTYTSLSDLTAMLKVAEAAGRVEFEASGRLLTATHQPLPGGDGRYQLAYTLSADGVEIRAKAEGASLPVRFILPVISRTGEPVDAKDAQTVRIGKAAGTLVVRTDAVRGFEPVPAERTFNLVPGFECVPLVVAMEPGKEVRIQLTVVGSEAKR
jgi:hypothetical protein